MKTQLFKDFSLAFGHPGGDRLEIRVLESAGGQARAESPLRMGQDLAVLAGAVAEGGRRPVRDFTSSFSPRHGRDLTKVGGAIFAGLFPPSIRSLWDESRGAARGEGARGLRIKLCLGMRGDEPAYRVPWELMHHPEADGFLALDPRCSIVRCLEVREETRSVEVPYPLRVAVVAANSVRSPLQLEAEMARIESAWGGQQGVEILPIPPSVQGIRDAIRDWQCHVLHFMGHGRFLPSSGHGQLQLEAPDGQPTYIAGAELGRWLKGAGALSLVVLNACSTAAVSADSKADPNRSLAPQLLRSGAPAVVGMAAPIADEAAIAFGGALYRHLARGEALDAAVTEGRLAMTEDVDSGTWSLPRLLLRSSTGSIVVRRGDEATGEVRRLLDLSLDLYRAGNYSEVRRIVARARQMAPGLDAADLLDSLAFAAASCLGRLSDREARNLDRCWGRLCGSRDSQVARRAALALAILRHDYFGQKRLKPPQPPSTDHVLVRAAGETMTPSDWDCLKPLRPSTAVALRLNLPLSRV